MSDQDVRRSADGNAGAGHEALRRAAVASRVSGILLITAGLSAVWLGHVGRSLLALGNGVLPDASIALFMLTNLEFPLLTVGLGALVVPAFLNAFASLRHLRSRG